MVTRLSSPRVVLVDDYQPLRQLLAEILADRGCVIVGEARDGREAITVVDDRRPDVVVMDMHMPTMNGVEATSSIRERHPEIEVVIFSSSDDPTLLAQAERAGASRVFAKTDMPPLVDHVAGARTPL